MPDLFHGITMDQIRSMQSMVGNGMWWENSQSAEWVGKAVADALLLDVKGDKKRISRMLKAWITEGALEVVEDQDERRKKRKRVVVGRRSEEHTSELQSLMRHSYDVFCMQKKKRQNNVRQYKHAQQQII